MNEFGQRVDIIRAKHNTCLNNTNLGSVTAVNGKILCHPTEYGSRKIYATTPPPTEYGSRKISATTPPTESIRAKLGLPPPPKWMLARTPMPLQYVSYDFDYCSRPRSTRCLEHTFEGKHRRLSAVLRESDQHVVHVLHCPGPFEARCRYASSETFRSCHGQLLQLSADLKSAVCFETTRSPRVNTTAFASATQ